MTEDIQARPMTIQADTINLYTGFPQEFWSNPTMKQKLNWKVFVECRYPQGITCTSPINQLTFSLSVTHIAENHFLPSLCWQKFQLDFLLVETPIGLSTGRI